MARWIESWLPGSPLGDDRASGHPGERFGLPASGHYSAAGFGRRLAGICIDWALATVLVGVVSGADMLDPASPRLWVLVVWFVLTSLMVAVLGGSPGHLLLGMRVARTDMATHVGVPMALLRTAMIAVVLPVLFLDADRRGWHDRASSTMVVRALRA